MASPPTKRDSAAPSLPAPALDELPSIDAALLGGVTGGAASGDASSMMLPMMIMMMKQRQHAAPVAAAPATTGFTVNGVQQSGTLGADGSYNYKYDGES